MRSIGRLPWPRGASLSPARGRLAMARAVCLSLSVGLGLTLTLSPASARETLADYYLNNDNDRYCPPRPQLGVTSDYSGDASIFTDPHIQMPAVLAVLNYELATNVWPNLDSGFRKPAVYVGSPGIGQLSGLPSSADVQGAIRAILNDPLLTIKYTGKQSLLAHTSGAQTLDVNDIIINQEGLYAGGAPLPFYTIGRHVIHELGHVFQQRNWTYLHEFLSTQAQKEVLPLQLEAGLAPDNFAPDVIARMAKHLNDARSIAGTWSSDYGDITFYHDPIVGDKPVQVTGFWQQDTDQRGRIDGGTFNPVTRKLDFSYTQEWDGSTGTASFTLTCSGSRMNGYCAGPWNAWRVLKWDQ